MNRVFINTETNEIATQIEDSKWYQVEGLTSHQLPLWVLNEDGEFSKTPWIEVKKTPEYTGSSIIHAPFIPVNQSISINNQIIWHHKWYINLVIQLRLFIKPIKHLNISINSWKVK